ncbi:MAG: trimeric intracellular cation channel family protein [Prevotella sp.]|nr:trimeric intracellular cation channel family protein [Prevotella sp.]MBQ7452348.1 trimeric intracellular cation channel family protein [Prevotella sp.]MBQ8059195.1 trimeric intracellular cation channel family protein [Prevotella sp.]MBR4269307.1 trimeric intracellular cation channel family protein [Prevotella sp.]
MEQDIIIKVIELLGTFAFAISGIRHAAAKHYDWFGGYVCGIAVAIGGGTIRDLMLSTTPFWMTTPVYMICTAVALFTVVWFGHWMEPLKNAWFVFDTLGLALFTIAGIQKSLLFGQPFWVAVIMGCITGAAGGVIRDILLNNEPVIFHKEIYAMASVIGGVVYWGVESLALPVGWSAVLSFIVTCLIRFLAVKYHISLPVLKERL